MSNGNGEVVSVKILRNETGSPKGKLADAEVIFEAGSGARVRQDVEPDVHARMHDTRSGPAHVRRRRPSCLQPDRPVLELFRELSPDSPAAMT